MQICEMVRNKAKKHGMDGSNAELFSFFIGKAVEVEPMKSMLKSSGTNSLNVTYDKLLPSFAFTFDLRRYTSASAAPTCTWCCACPPWATCSASGCASSPPSSTAGRAAYVIHRIVYRCSPRHPPHSVQMLATPPPRVAPSSIPSTALYDLLIIIYLALTAVPSTGSASGRLTP